MPEWLNHLLERSGAFMPHGHCYLWIPSLLWLHVLSDLLIGVAYLGISLLLYLLVRKIRLPFSPVFIAFGLFIALCGVTHFMSVWTVWNADYLADGMIKAATAAASVATAVGLLYVRPQIEAVVHAARLSEERRIQLEATHAELEALYNKLTALDRQKTDFFANVSHELRTPLALILGPVELLLRDATLSQQQTRQLELINRNGQMLLKQVNDLLDVAKLEASKMTVRYVELEFATWLRRIASQFEMAAEQRQISYRIVTPQTLLVQVDPAMIERVVVNLLSNAFKFTPSGGEVSVRVESSAHEVQLSVEDTGPGIAADQHESIFERFRQVEGGATRQYGGTGLGLAIVKSFVQLHGGRVELISSPGHGARFIVYLPLKAAQGIDVQASTESAAAAAPVALASALHELALQTAQNDPAEPVQLAGRATVLVVEDNADMQQFLANALASEFNVMTATDGREGLAKALALQPDLVVTDVMMPHMSGDQLVAALREHSEFNSVPILLLTAKADDELRIHLLQTGAQDYLTKPFLTQELLARAGNLIAMKRAGDTLRVELMSASNDVEELARELTVRHRQLQVALATAEFAKERAERATEIKTQFLGMISHELRTPLSVMNTNAQLLARHVELPPALTNVLPRLQRSIQQMSTLIDGLLEYTRVESGRVEVKPELVDLRILASEAVEGHLDMAPAGVRVQLEHEGSIGAPVFTDPRLLRVVLDNLLSNALKFTKEGSVVIRLRTTQEQRTIEIHDTGIGIAAADIPRIFEPFEQLEPVKRKSIPGVGLGLALVRQIVEMLHGTLDVRSAPGEGSVFSVVLPADIRSGARSELESVARGL